VLVERLAVAASDTEPPLAEFGVDSR